MLPSHVGRALQMALVRPWPKPKVETPAQPLSERRWVWIRLEPLWIFGSRLPTMWSGHLPRAPRNHEGSRARSLATERLQRAIGNRTITETSCDSTSGRTGVGGRFFCRSARSGLWAKMAPVRGRCSPSLHPVLSDRPPAGRSGGTISLTRPGTDWPGLGRYAVQILRILEQLSASHSSRPRVE